MSALAWLLLALVGLTPADDAERERSLALRAWREALSEGPAAQQAALLPLARLDHAEVVAALLRDLPRVALPVRAELRRRLGATRDPASLDLLRTAGLGAEHPETREHAALVVAESVPPGNDWGVRLQLLLDDEQPAVRAAAVFALGRLRYAAALPGLIAASRDGSVRVRRRAPAALVRVAGERCVPQLTRSLSDPSWRVRAAAARALGELRSRHAALALVERLPRETGRVREELLDALVAHAGHNFGLDVAAWRRWLELRAGERDRSLRPRDGAPTSVVRAVDGAPRYYDLPTLSARFVLITDVSGSMSARIPVREDRLGGPELTRIGLARQEARRLVDELPEGVHFNLFTFSERVDTWRSELVPAERGQRASARLAIDAWRPGGGTNLHGALALAFDDAQAELDGERRAERRAADTLFLLTDGGPTLGELTNVELLLAWVAERNRDLDLRIHCVSFEERSELLERLAALTGGELVTPLD